MAPLALGPLPSEPEGWRAHGGPSHAIRRPHPDLHRGHDVPRALCRARGILSIALLAERAGFDSLWGNDHMTTQRYVQREWPEPPNFYEPLITFTYVAARTQRIRLATGIIVLPMRNMPVLAKQAATLDQLSGGRLILGVGTGAYREAYEALFPDARGVRRGELVDEGMRALRLLFTERRATFPGRHVRFQDVECFPKPRQRPLPMYAGGNHAEVRRRAGAYAEGWMPAVLSPEEIARGVADVHRAAGAAGRDGGAIDIAPQFACSIGRTHEEAIRQFHASQLYKHLEPLARSPLREQTGGFEQRNLIGNPEEICERIRLYERAGVTTCSGLLFVANSVPEMNEAIELFGRAVIPHFR
jgi:probable F420-dependent oxidoreductase